MGWAERVTPGVGCLKLNLDASSHPSKMGVGLGAVIRDEFGVLVAAHVVFRSVSLEAEAGEAPVLLEGLKLAEACGSYQVWIEIDAEVVKKIHALSFALSLGVIYAKIYNLMITLRSTGLSFAHA